MVVKRNNVYQDRCDFNEQSDFILSMIYNNNTLNIFSDASMRKHGSKQLDSCYGSVAVCKDNILDELFKINTDCTVPAAELRGIRLSLDLAFKYRYMFPVINIFSDSQISVMSIREYFYKWVYDINTNQYYTGTIKRMGSPAKNQHLILECVQMVELLRLTNVVNIYHQKGHIGNELNEMIDAINVFKRENHIKGKIDYNLIRYISTYNNYVDNRSRSIIRRTNIYDNVYRDPLTFHPISNFTIN